MHDIACEGAWELSLFKSKVPMLGLSPWKQMPFFAYPCLPLCSHELLPIVKRGTPWFFLRRDWTCLFFKGHDAAGHWSRLFARSREQPWCNPCSVCATPPAVRLQTVGGHRRSVFEKKSVRFCHCAFSVIDRMNIEPSVVACVK